MTGQVEADVARPVVTAEPMDRAPGRIKLADPVVEEIRDVDVADKIDRDAPRLLELTCAVALDPHLMRNPPMLVNFCTR